MLKNIETLTLFAVLAVGIAVGFINIVSAGGSMLTLPMLIFFGLPSTVANGTNRIAILVQNCFALYQFHKNGHLNWRLSLMLAVPTTIASVYGARIAVNIADETFDTLLATFMVIFAVLLIIKPQRYMKGNLNLKVSIPLLLVAFTLIGFYGGTLQAGVGFFISLILLMLIPRIPMAEVHGIKTLVVTIYVSISLLVFIFNDMIDWKFAIALSIGSAIGGSFGGKYASVMPDRLLQRILIGAIIFFALILVLK